VLRVLIAYYSADIADAQKQQCRQESPSSHRRFCLALLDIDVDAAIARCEILPLDKATMSAATFKVARQYWLTHFNALFPPLRHGEPLSRDFIGRRHC